MRSRECCCGVTFVIIAGLGSMWCCSIWLACVRVWLCLRMRSYACMCMRMVPCVSVVCVCVWLLLVVVRVCVAVVGCCVLCDG